MAQQTAIEWLRQELLKRDMDISIKDLFEQAKQMEKEQIETAWRNGDNDSMYLPKELDEQAEQYYNEMYTTNKTENDK